MERQRVSGTADDTREGSTQMESNQFEQRSSRMSAIKRAIAGTLVALVLVGGSLAGTAAKAGSPAEAGSAGTGYTETTGTTTDDGTLIFICTYDDVTGELLFCDVIFYPSGSAKAGKGGDHKGVAAAPQKSEKSGKGGRHKKR